MHLPRFLSRRQPAARAALVDTLPAAMLARTDAMLAAATSARLNGSR